MDAFDRPFGRLGLAAGPDLATHNRPLGRRAGLEDERVPLPCLPGEGDGLGEVGGDLRGPGAELELLARPHQIERVTLGDDPHVGHPGLLERRRITKRLGKSFGIAAGRFGRVAGGWRGRVARFADPRFRGAEVGLDAVVMEIDRPDPALRPRPLGDRCDLHEHLAAVDLADDVPVPHPNPGKRGLPLHDARLLILVERDLLEVELPRQRRHRADPRLARELANLGRDDRGSMLVGRRLVGAVGRYRAGGRGELGR